MSRAVQKSWRVWSCITIREIWYRNETGDDIVSCLDLAIHGARIQSVIYTLHYLVPFPTDVL